MQVHIVILTALYIQKRGFVRFSSLLGTNSYSHVETHTTVHNCLTCTGPIILFLPPGIPSSLIAESEIKRSVRNCILAFYKYYFCNIQHTVHRWLFNNIYQNVQSPKKY